MERASDPCVNTTIPCKLFIILLSPVEDAWSWLRLPLVCRKFKIQFYFLSEIYASPNLARYVKGWPGYIIVKGWVCNERTRLDSSERDWGKLEFMWTLHLAMGYFQNATNSDFCESYWVRKVSNGSLRLAMKKASKYRLSLADFRTTELPDQILVSFYCYSVDTISCEMTNCFQRKCLAGGIWAQTCTIIKKKHMKFMSFGSSYRKKSWFKNLEASNALCSSLFCCTLQ